MAGRVGHLGLIMAGFGLLAGCVGTGGGGSADAAPVETTSAKSVKLVDRDVEAPNVFQVTDTALWDGRPSLGGVWVASPDAKDPERVILRNPANGKFVIGALFRRERDNPGPKLQISSDAATALGLLAGAPAKINVTALRREEVPQTAPDANKPILDAAETVTAQPLAKAGDKTTDKAATKGQAKSAGATAASATAALDRAQAGTGTAAKPAIPTAPTATKPTPPAKSAGAGAGGALIQIGIFSVEANANRAVEQLAKAGVPAEIRKGESQGKAFWQVTSRGDTAVLAKVKAAGFKDAYVQKR